MGIKTLFSAPYNPRTNRDGSVAPVAYPFHGDSASPPSLPGESVFTQCFMSTRQQSMSSVQQLALNRALLLEGAQERLGSTFCPTKTNSFLLSTAFQVAMSKVNDIACKQVTGLTRGYHNGESDKNNFGDNARGISEYDSQSKIPPDYQHNMIHAEPSFDCKLPQRELNQSLASTIRRIILHHYWRVHNKKTMQQGLKTPFLVVNFK